jgi:hypothetical protein
MGCEDIELFYAAGNGFLRYCIGSDGFAAN